jgi:hypothetical protein
MTSTQRFFIHCAEDFSLEEEGADEIAVFGRLSEAIKSARALQREAEARLTVFSDQGTVIIDTVFPQEDRELVESVIG